MSVMSEQNTRQPAGPSQPTAIRTNEVRSLPCFEPRAEPHSLSVRWKRWKRSFDLYVLAKGIVEDRQKVALLLHTAGQEVQDLYYTLAGPGEELRDYKDVVELLDSYFVPKVNVPFERHVFRQMEQQSHEKVDQFVCRLRQKAITCEFANVDETIRDQLIEKCRDGRLRRKFLEKTNAPLKDLQDIARSDEAVDAQMESMNKSPISSRDQVNSVKQQKFQTKGRGRDPKKGGSNIRSPGPGAEQPKACYNCNRLGHYARDSCCPAKNKECGKCGARGHFAVCCGNKKLSSSSQKGIVPETKKKAYLVAEGVSGEGDGYAFTVGGGLRVGEITLKVGGVVLDSVRIDSGASYNLIDYNTWNNMKQNRIECESQVSDKKLFAYGQKEPLEVVGTFVAEVVCEDNGAECVDEFRFIKGTGRPLLGKKTAEKLNVLRVGPENVPNICSIVEEGCDQDIRESYADILTGVGKLKDYRLKLHINKEVKPVAQQVRRLPFGLRDKVDLKLDDLLSKDIIEEVPDTPTSWISPLVVAPKRTVTSLRRYEKGKRSDYSRTSSDTNDRRSSLRS